MTTATEQSTRRRKAVLLNPFSFFASYPPATTAYLAGLLKQQGVAATQVDVNLEIWDHLLSPEFVAQRRYRPENLKHSPCPYCPPTTTRRFESLKRFVVANIEQAKNVLRDPQGFYDFKKFNWAQVVIYQAQLVIFYEFGTFLTSHIAFWPWLGFEVNSVSRIYALSEDRDHNPFIEAIERVILPRLVELDPDLLLLDIVWPWDIVSALTLLKLAKKALPGVHISYPGQGFDEFTFSRLRHRLPREPALLFEFDSAFLYRNDPGVVELAKIENRTPEALGSIRNLAHRTPDGGVRINEPFDKKGYVPGVEPCYDDLPLARYFSPRTVFVDRLSHRCYWARCNYCSINAHIGAQQEGDIDAVIRRLRGYRDRYGCRHVWFMDEACPPDLAVRFSDELAAAGLDLTWSLRTRVDGAYTRGVLERLRATGLRELWLGLEAVDPGVLRLMNKTDRPEEHSATAARLLRDCAELGIGIHFCLLMGMPSETPAQRRMLVEFFQRNEEWLSRASFFVTFNAFALVNESPMYRDPERFGIKSIEEGPDCFNMSRIPYRTRWGDETHSEQAKKALGECTEELLGVIVKDENLLLSWFAVADSPYELLFKEHYAGTRTGNPFQRRPSALSRMVARAYRRVESLPFLGNPCRELFKRRVVGLQ